MACHIPRSKTVVIEKENMGPVEYSQSENTVKRNSTKRPPPGTLFHEVRGDRCVILFRIFLEFYISNYSLWGLWSSPMKLEKVIFGDWIINLILLVNFRFDLKTRRRFDVLGDLWTVSRQHCLAVWHNAILLTEVEQTNEQSDLLWRGMLSLFALCSFFWM